jgi:hypothetical protein
MLRAGGRITDERRKVWEFVYPQASPDLTKKWWVALDIAAGRPPRGADGKKLFPDRLSAERFLDNIVARNPDARRRADALSAVSSLHVCFDAQNGYGALVRAVATCSFGEPLEPTAPLALLRPAHVTDLQVLKDLYCSE